MGDRTVQEYRDYLAGGAYRDYAYSASEQQDDMPAQAQTAGSEMDLSLWGDSLPDHLAKAAAKVAAESVSKYHLAQDDALLEQISFQFGYRPGQVKIVAGADDALRIVAQYCIRPGTKVLVPLPSFVKYATHAFVNQADIRYLNFTTYPYKIDVQEVIYYANEQGIECIFIPNPNNPTGSRLTVDELTHLLESTSASVVLDESLLLDPKESIPTTLLDTYENLFVCGSFSKLYNLAGARIGYIAANEKHNAALQNLISPFEVDAFSIEMAKLVLEDTEWIAARRKDIRKGIAVLQNMKHPRLRISQTDAPVALLECTEATVSLFELLRANGILTVPGEEFYGLENTNTVRIIIRNEQDVSHLIKTLQRVL